jgi:hypothetical protein
VIQTTPMYSTLLRYPFIPANYPRLTLNYRKCELCQEHFLVDSSHSKFCGRELCVAVRIHLQKQVEAEAEQRRQAVA